MTRRIRRILFACAVVIFVVASYASILYAQGYKYDFGQAKFSLTGTVAIKANVNAVLTLENGKPRKTSFLGNSASINGLLPGIYLIKVEKEGYYPWQKRAVVQEGFVTDFPKVLLISQLEEDQPSLQEEIKNILYPSKSSATLTPSLTPSPVSTASQPFYLKDKTLYQNQSEKSPVILSKDASGFAQSDDERKITWWNNHEIWVLWLEATNYQPFHKGGDKELIVRFSSPIKKANWFRDNDHLVVDSGSRYHILEIDTRGGVNVVKI